MYQILSQQWLPLPMMSWSTNSRPCMAALLQWPPSFVAHQYHQIACHASIQLHGDGTQLPQDISSHGHSTCRCMMPVQCTCNACHGMKQRLFMQGAGHAVRSVHGLGHYHLQVCSDNQDHLHGGVILMLGTPCAPQCQVHAGPLP